MDILGATVTRTATADMVAPLTATVGEDHTAEDSVEVLAIKCPTLGLA